MNTSGQPLKTRYAQGRLGSRRNHKHSQSSRRANIALGRDGQRYRESSFNRALRPRSFPRTLAVCSSRQHNQERGSGPVLLRGKHARTSVV